MRHLEVREALLEDRLPVQRMLELYQHDLCDIWNQDIDASGEYRYALDRYWSAADGSKAYVARVDGQYADFALVDRASKVAPG